MYDKNSIDESAEREGIALAKQNRRKDINTNRIRQQKDNDYNRKQFDKLFRN